MWERTFFTRLTTRVKNVAASGVNWPLVTMSNVPGSLGEVRPLDHVALSEDCLNQFLDR